MKLSKVTGSFMALGVLFFLRGVSFAEEEVYKIAIKNHQFLPQELVIPAGKKVRILIENEDPSAEEFESYELNREKVVGGHGKATLFIGPLKTGSYKYFGDFHKDTAEGVIKAVE